MNIFETSEICKLNFLNHQLIWACGYDPSKGLSTSRTWLHIPSKKWPFNIHVPKKISHTKHIKICITICNHPYKHHLKMLNRLCQYYKSETTLSKRIYTFKIESSKVQNDFLFFRKVLASPNLLLKAFNMKNVGLQTGWIKQLASKNIYTMICYSIFIQRKQR